MAAEEPASGPPAFSLSASAPAEPMAAVTTSPSATPSLPSEGFFDRLRHSRPQIDRYTILDELGEGGMGTVFRAEQREPIRRTVAIKLLKIGMDSKQAVARFEAERQA